MHNVYIHNFQFNVTQIACNRLITSVLIQQTAQSIIMICHHPTLSSSGGYIKKTYKYSRFC